MLLPVLAREEQITEHLRQSAVKLGVAMQMTNILRGVAEDRKNGRIYLPWNLLLAHPEADWSLYNGVMSTGWKTFAQHWIAMARDKYTVGLDICLHCRQECKIPLFVAARFYAAILDEIERRDYHVFEGRVIVNAHRKKELLALVERKTSVSA